jgi:hypothetical protein
MRRAILVLLLTFCLPGCKKKSGGLDDCAYSVGTCHQHSVACGIQFACDDGFRQLRCTPPPEGATTIQCQCVENNVLGEKVELVYPMSGGATETAATACGWKR